MIMVGSETTRNDVAQAVSEQHQQLSAWLQDEFDYRRPKRGEIREAMILDIGENDVIVDIGDKQDGVVPRRDLELLDKTFRAGLSVGGRVPVVILKPSDQREGILVSINMGQQQGDWLRAADLVQSGEMVEAEIVEANRGGVLVSFGRLRGFVPNSHLAMVPRGLREEQLREAKAALIGRTLHLVVIEVEQHRRRLVLSERKAGNQRRAQLLQHLTEGETRTGTVTNLAKFGAFVDLGGIDGLIHISELDWKHIEHPSEVLKPGDVVEVCVLRVDREKARIGLSRKRLLPDPWHEVTERLDVGQVVRGTVINVADFGVFVELEHGVEGLVHSSEIPPEAETGALATGAPISVRVLEVDHDRRRIALSLRGMDSAIAQAFQDGWSDLHAAQLSAGSMSDETQAQTEGEAERTTT
jgi:small subunit ribosomal protein S1